MPTPATTRQPSACPRCARAIGGEVKAATALDGSVICESCQHAELDELIELLERTTPGPALPANLIPVEERRRARQGGAGR
ncbi:MAG TPA: hypothetical protein VF406_03845 [Thermodesulfobacteriota bacterium]